MMKKFSTAVLAAASLLSAASITVDPSTTKQEIIGFGGGSVYYQNWIAKLSAEDQEALFDTAFTGLNLSLLRIGNWLQDESKDLADDINIIKAAQKRLGNNLKIEMSSWSAPGNLKPSGSLNGYDGHSKSDKTLKKATGDAYGAYAYTDFANWWKKSLESYAAQGIVPDYISLQNEPDMEATYEETLFGPSETDEIAGYKEALNAVYDAVKGKAKILGPEPLGIGYGNFDKYAKELDANKLDGYAYHLYHAINGDSSATNYENPENFRTPMKSIADNYGTKPIIMTEFCPMLDEPRELDMIGLAHIMQVGFTDGKLGGYIAWQLFWGHHSQMIGVCPGAGWDLTGDGKYVCEGKEIKIFPEYHAMRHYSKFVNPGWKVIASTSAEKDLKTVAFANTSSDSVSVVLVNSGKTAIQLDAPAISGMNVATAVQSKENGFKSQNITIASCYVLPARSITTLVLTKTAAVSTITACQDETTDPDYTEPVVTPSSEIVIVDYSKTNSVSNWSGDFTVTYGTTEIDGVSGYAVVPQAGCAQGSDGCEYQHAILSVPAASVSALSTCKELVITMHSQDDTTAYVNVGGAGGTEWVNYNYGRQAGSASWTEATVDLTNEASTGSKSITFNSDASGIYISKIVATGCGSQSITPSLHYAANDNNAEAKIFDLNGNLVWTGLKGKALDANGTLRIDLHQGMYIVKTKLSTVKAVKK